MSGAAENRVLLVEDDHELALMVAEFLASYGFDVAIEERGDRAIARIKGDRPDVVILDVNLPGLDGFSVCRQVRADFSGPILILTARGEEVDEVVGLEVGADDYMAKPVRPRALLARLRAHLRRVPTDVGTHASCVEVGSLLVDASRRVAELRGATVDLTSAEFDLLWLLATHAGQVLSRNDIHLELNGVKYDGMDRSIDLRVSRLRKKLNDDSSNPRRIKSVRGVGYILSVEQ